MAELINLNRVRKAKAHAADKAEAAENRARFGRTKGERAEAEAARLHSARQLDGAKRE